MPARLNSYTWPVTKTSPSRSVHNSQPLRADVFPSRMLTVPRQAEMVLTSRIAVLASGSVNRPSVCCTGQIVRFRSEIYTTSIVVKNTDSDARMMDNATLPVLNLFIERTSVKTLILLPSNPPDRDISRPRADGGRAHWGFPQSCKRAGEMPFSIPV